MKGLKSWKGRVSKEKIGFEVSLRQILWKADSGLPVDLYLDDSGLYKEVQQKRRIGFAADKRNWIDKDVTVYLSIEDNPKVFPKHVKTGLSPHELEKVRHFIRINRVLLKALSDEKIDFDNFINQMIKCEDGIK